MTETWGEISIDEIKSPTRYSLAMGPFGSNIKTDNFVPIGVPIIRGGNLSEDHFKDSNFVFLTEEKADELKSANAFAGDLVFTHRGTLGQVGIIPENAKYPRYVVSQSQMKLSCDLSKVDPYFVYYFFRSRKGQHELLSKTSTTGVPAISSPLSTLRSIRIPYPPLQIQHRIARIIRSFDDKIELNRKINETLEALARALFQSWFIDFDPVRAKAEGRQPEGMDAATAALFPSELEEIEGREVPRGWDIKPLSNSFNIIMGQSPPGTTYNEIGEGIPFFQGRTDFGFRYPSVRVYCSAPTRFAEVGDTLISVRAPVGDINMAQERCCIGRGVGAIRHKTGSRSFTYYEMLSLKEIFAVFESEGTVFGSITKTDFNSIKCITPPNEIVKKFEQIVFPIDQMMENKEKQSRKLAKNRDTLLPKLMSGEIDVKNIKPETPA